MNTSKIIDKIEENSSHHSKKKKASKTTAKIKEDNNQINKKIARKYLKQ